MGGDVRFVMVKRAGAIGHMGIGREGHVPETAMDSIRVVAATGKKLI